MSFLKDPSFMKRAQGGLTLFWLLMIPVSIITGWINSVAYVSALSLWALVASHGAWWAAASVEAQQLEEDVATDVVEKLVEETDVSPA